MNNDKHLRGIVIIMENELMKRLKKALSRGGHFNNSNKIHHKTGKVLGGTIMRCAWNKGNKERAFPDLTTAVDYL